METQISTLHNDMKTTMENSFLKYQLHHEINLNESVEYIESVVNMSATELTEKQTEIKDVIVENQIGMTTLIEEKLYRTIDRLGLSINEQTSKIDNIQQEVGTKQKETNVKLDRSFIELKDKIDAMNNEFGITLSQSNVKLEQSLNEMKKQNVAIQNEVVVRHEGTNDKISQMRYTVVNTLSDVNSKYSDVLQGLNNNYELLEQSKSQFVENENRIKSTKQFIHALFMVLKIQIVKSSTITEVRNYDRNTRLAG